jgi:hypothetical protein
VQQLTKDVATFTTQLAQAKAAPKPRRKAPSPPDDSSDDENDRDPCNPGRADRRRSCMRARHSKSKHYEPDKFDRVNTTSSDYLKWKLDIQEHFDKYPRDYSTEGSRLAFIRRKTEKQAWGNIEHGWIVPGQEFVYKADVGDILSSVYQPINSALTAQR